MAKSKFEQYMLIGVGVMVAIGFSGVFTYGSLVNTPDRPNQQEQEIEAELPNQTYQEGSIGLSIREQAYLSVKEEVVFVNGFYENDSTIYLDLEDLPSQFNDRVYINTLNRSETTIGSNLQMEMPSALIIGDQRSQRAPYTMQRAEPGRESIQQGICTAMRDVTEFGATCFS